MPLRHLGFGVTRPLRMLQMPNPARLKNAAGSLHVERKFIGQKSIVYFRRAVVRRRYFSRSLSVFLVSIFFAWPHARDALGR